jgi:HEPN domain-containing protein
VTSRKIARDYLAKVEARVEALRLFLARGRYDDVIREAHEALELLLKGALRFVGIDPPRRHDPGAVLLRHLDRFPASWRDRAPAICEASEQLFAERGHAFYGDEDDLVPPSELFERSEAEDAIDTVDGLLALYRELLAEEPPAAP